MPLFGQPIVLPGDPTSANQAATKSYVDAKVAAGGGGTPTALSYVGDIPSGTAVVSIAHGLATTDVNVSVRETSTGLWVPVANRTTDANTVELTFGAAPTAGQYRIYVVAATGTSSTIAVQVAALPQGRLTSAVTTTQVTGISTTETVTDQLSASVTAGRRYRLTWSCGWYATALDQYYLTFRYAAGATISAASTQFHRRMVGVMVANTRAPLVMVADVLAPSTGTLAFGVSVVRATGTGTFIRDGSTDTESVMLLDDVGAS